MSALVARSERPVLRWFIGLCRWCWRQRGFVWGTLIIGLGANAFGAWLFTPLSTNYRNLPIGWAFQHPAIFVVVGVLCLAFSFCAYIGWRFEATNEPATSGHITPVNMPLALDLVGREAELRKVVRLARTSQAIGVYGMGGVGKSTLAAAAVKQLHQDQGAFPGGATWVSCEGLTGETGLAALWQRVAKTLDLINVTQEMTFDQQRDTLALALAKRARTLLALDNLEPDLDAPAALATLLVPGHTGVLITARQKVDADLDEQIELKPLTIQDTVRLYTDKVHRDDQKRPSDTEKQALPQLATELGGLPLAIQLTAKYAITQRIGLDRVLAEVREDKLHAAGLDNLQDGLLARFNRSLRVLSESQQQLFAGLSLLTSATFPRAAAIAVAAVTLDATAKHASPQKDVAALVAVALVEPVAGERLRIDSLLLHPLLREYAAERFAGLPLEVQERIGDAVLAFWIRYSKEQVDVHEYVVLEADADCLMGALAWGHAHGRSRPLLSLVRLLAAPWKLRGRRDDEARMFRWACDAASAIGDPRQEWWATQRLAVVDAYQGRMDDARAGFTRALALAQATGSHEAERDTIHEVAILDQLQGRLADAYEHFQQALSLDRELSTVAGEREELHGLGRLAAVEGAALQGEERRRKLEEARAFFTRALELAQQLDDREGQHTEAERAEVHELARLAELGGHLKQARDGFAQALALSRKLDHRFYIAMDSRHLGFVTGLLGDSKKGHALINEALEFFKESSDVYASGLCYWRLAELDERDRKRDAALGNYREALWRFDHVQSPNADKVRAALRRLGIEP